MVHIKSDGSYEIVYNAVIKADANKGTLEVKAPISSFSRYIYAR